MHASFAARFRLRSLRSIIVETGGLRIWQIIESFLLHPGVMDAVLCPVSFEDTLKRFQPLSLGDPESPVGLQSLLAVTHYLLLCLDGRVQPAEEILIVLPVGRIHS